LVLLVQPPAILTPADAAAVTQVEQDNDTALVAKLARRFTALACACNASQKTDLHTASAERSGLSKPVPPACPSSRHSPPDCKEMEAQLALLSRPLEQWTNRRTGQSAEADQTPGVRSCQLRATPPPRSPGGMIHAKCGRTEFRGPSQTDPAEAAVRTVAAMRSLDWTWPSSFTFVIMEGS
jgi:hypothetical protein